MAKTGDRERERPRMAVPAAWVTGILILSGVLLTAVGPARAAEKPFRIEFNRSELQIGALGNLGRLPLDPAEPASLDGTWSPSTGRVTVPKGGFLLPGVGVTDPVNVKLFLGVEDVAKGSFSPDTGSLVLDTRAGLWVSLNLKQLLDLLAGSGVDIDLIAGANAGTLSLLTTFMPTLTCGFSPMDICFTTGATSLGSGTPFGRGPSGTGTLVAEWSKLGPFAGRTKLPIINADPCLLIRGMLPGLLGSLGGGAPSGVGAGLGGLDLNALLAGLDSLDLGPSRLTLIRTVGGSGTPAGPRSGRPVLRIAAIPGRRKVRVADRARFRVTVRNVGRVIARKATLCIAGFAIRRRCVGLGRIGAGAATTRMLPARVMPRLLERRFQFVLRPRFTARARGAEPVRIRSRRAQVRVSRHPR